LKKAPKLSAASDSIDHVPEFYLKVSAFTPLAPVDFRLEIPDSTAFLCDLWFSLSRLDCRLEIPDSPDYPVHSEFYFKIGASTPEARA